MAGSSMFSNLARAAKVLALLLFLLPWVTVSCSPQVARPAGAPEASPMPGGSSDLVLISASGMQLATGTATPTSQGAGAVNNSGAQNPFAAPDMFVIGGAVLILLSLLASFLLKGAVSFIAGIAGSALAAGCLCYTVMMRIPKAVADSFNASNSGTGAGGAPADMAQMIQTKAQIGFWLVILALVAAIVLNVLAMSKGSGAAATTAPPAA